MPSALFAMQESSPQMADQCTDQNPTDAKSMLILCAGCGQRIRDRYYLLAVDRQWHCRCLRCDHCGQELESELSCFARHGLIYCKEDYHRLFCWHKCIRCVETIRPRELVMRIGDHYYHTECFRCSVCDQRLIKGDYFGRHNNHIYCSYHYQQLIDSNCQTEANPPEDQSASAGTPDSDPLDDKKSLKSIDDSYQQKPKVYKKRKTSKLCQKFIDKCESNASKTETNNFFHHFSQTFEKYFFQTFLNVFQTKRDTNSWVRWRQSWREPKSGITWQPMASSGISSGTDGHCLSSMNSRTIDSKMSKNLFNRGSGHWLIAIFVFSIELLFSSDKSIKIDEQNDWLLTKLEPKFINFLFISINKCLNNETKISFHRLIGFFWAIVSTVPSICISKQWAHQWWSRPSLRQMSTQLALSMIPGIKGSNARLLGIQWGSGISSEEVVKLNLRLHAKWQVPLNEPIDDHA